MKRKVSIGNGIQITLDITKIKAMQEELSKKYVAQVGILGQKNNRIVMEMGESHERYKLRVKKILQSRKDVQQNQEQTNAEIGLKQEMGSRSERIPRRSFLEMPLTLKMPAYARTFGNELMKAIEDGNLKPVYVNLGIKGEQVVQMAFASRGFGIWPDNAPYTIAKKGSSTPLIDTGQLRRAITSDVVTK